MMDPCTCSCNCYYCNGGHNARAHLCSFGHASWCETRLGPVRRALGAAERQQAEWARTRR